MNEDKLNVKLNLIQQNLNAPKGQKNSFGNYNYRSCEDILSAVKLLLDETHTVLIISDEMIMLGDRFYVKATAKLSSGEEAISVNGWARESLTKKGMDESQITGAASSYARKYALNGLFCIDDTKDADATNTHDKETPKSFPGKQRANNPNPEPMSTPKFHCTNKKCGAEITEKVANYSKEHFGALLCFDCQKKAKQEQERQEEILEETVQ